MPTEKTGNKTFLQIDLLETTAGVDRRAFLMRNASSGAAAVLTGWSAEEKATQVGSARLPAPSPASPPALAADLAPDLKAVKKSKGPVMTTTDEFYKVGRGPSNSQAIGPMRIIDTAPREGSSGVMSALVYALGEGGCQAEIGIAFAMGAALIRQAHEFSPQVVANAAESSPQHHFGMTCDLVAGFVQNLCIERCALSAVKAWTAFMIASNEIPANHRVDFDTTVDARKGGSC